MTSTKQQNIFIIILIIVFIGLIIVVERAAPLEDEFRRIPPPDRNKVSKGMDYSKSGTHYKYYTDDEIRYMRESNSHLIIQTPGRVILSKEEEFENYLEEYIETHEDELEELLNR